RTTASASPSTKASRTRSPPSRRPGSAVGPQAAGASCPPSPTPFQATSRPSPFSAPKTTPGETAPASWRAVSPKKGSTSSWRETRRMGDHDINHIHQTKGVDAARDFHDGARPFKPNGAGLSAPLADTVKVFRERLALKNDDPVYVTL